MSPMARPLPATLMAALLVAFAACTSGPPAPDDTNYPESIQEWRSARERALSENPDEIPPERRDDLLPLPYYDPDPRYAVPAELRLSDRRQTVEMQTSAGTL